MNVGHELEIASCCGVNPVPSDVSEDLRVIVRWASGGHAEYRGFQMNGCQIG